MTLTYIDLTQTFTAAMPVYPGDPPAQLTEISKGGIVDHLLKSGMHVGTHMDAPRHMLRGGKNLSDYGVEKFFGRGVLIDARGKDSAGPELLGPVVIQPGDIVLVNFGWADKFGRAEYFAGHPVLTEEFARKLAGSGASIVGLDTPSPDYSPYLVHKLLLGRDILIIENLAELSKLGSQAFEVMALPAKLQADAAFCRVVAKVFSK
ncbi:MAG: cyclase family protein [Patescibacteria group bacterium]|nr:cyclase family protein [Patescibacteria group bacterium]